MIWRAVFGLTASPATGLQVGTTLGDEENRRSFVRCSVALRRATGTAELQALVAVGNAAECAVRHDKSVENLGSGNMWPLSGMRQWCCCCQMHSLAW